MLYKREHVARERAQFDDWLSFTTDTAHENGRLAIAGVGAYMNGIEGTLRQGRRARAAGADGILMFAVGDTAPWSTAANSTNTAVKRNPYSLSAPGKTTPKRPNEDFAAAVTTGRNANGKLGFEPGRRSPIFSLTASPPAKNASAVGSVMGYTHRDSAAITMESEDGRRSTITDGSGFFGFTNVAPGDYRVEGCAVHVAANRVSRVDLPCTNN